MPIRPGEKRGDAVGLAGKGKGSRLMLATDANGLPLVMLTTSAGVGAAHMAEATLATIRMPQEKGKPKSRPRQLIADKEYDRSVSPSRPCCADCCPVPSGISCEGRFSPPFEQPERRDGRDPYGDGEPPHALGPDRRHPACCAIALRIRVLTGAAAGTAPKMM